MGDGVTGGRKAAPSYEFFRRAGSRALVRRFGPDGRPERLVDGGWVPVRLGRSQLGEDPWKPLSELELRNHRRRYIVYDLEAPSSAWARPRRRLERGWLGRLLVPPLKGGARRRNLKHATVERSREGYERILREASDGSLELLQEQALLGLEHQRARVAGAEQRANFFLGAAGLTTTLVLANASILIGEGKLREPWRAVATGALIFASICALMSGIRALQAAMLTFSRTPPNSIGRLLARRNEETPEDVRRSYVAAILVGVGRIGIVGDWKIARMGEARSWFLGVILGALGVTACVLFGAVF